MVTALKSKPKAHNQNDLFNFMFWKPTLNTVLECNEINNCTLTFPFIATVHFYKL